MSVRSEYNSAPGTQSLHALLRQEQAIDALEDRQLLKQQIYAATSASSSTGLSFHNKVWRKMVSDWFLRLIDGVGMGREVAFHSMSLLDRFLAINNKSSGHNCRADNAREYQVAATTALLLAANSFGGIIGSRLRPRHLIKTSKERITIEDIATCAKKMLSSLSLSRQPPPTPSSFVHSILQLLPPSVGNIVRTHILNDATFLVELVANDWSFVGERASLIAYAAVLCVVDDCAKLERGAAIALGSAVDASGGLRIHPTKMEDMKAAVKKAYREYCGDGGNHSHSDNATATGAVNVVPYLEGEVEVGSLHNATGCIHDHCEQSCHKAHQKRQLLSDESTPSQLKRQRKGGIFHG